jgi:hypothetical protein
MDAKTPTTTPEETPEETPEQRGKLLDAKGRDLIERILAQHPELTAAEAIEHTREMGGL